MTVRRNWTLGTDILGSGNEALITAVHSLQSSRATRFCSTCTNWPLTTWIILILKCYDTVVVVCLRSASYYAIRRWFPYTSVKKQPLGSFELLTKFLRLINPQWMHYFAMTPEHSLNAEVKRKPAQVMSDCKRLLIQNYKQDPHFNTVISENLK